jgi:branched-chain amino acid transport system permease protein
MSTAWQFYITTVLVYLGVDIIACWGLNLQYGYTGILNFAYIVFQSAGAYTYAVLTLGRASPGGFQRYVLGMSLPFPLPVIAAGIAGGLLAAVIGAVGLRRLRSDYQAMVMLVIGLIATTVVTNASGVFNGAAGLSLIPKPLQADLNLTLIGYQWFYVLLTAAFCVITYWVVHRITQAPFGRSLRAVRDQEQAAASLGKNVTALRMTSFITGGVIAGISGALLAGFISAWSPGSWLYQETFVYFTALIVGGVANNAGAALGALLVPVAFLEATRFLPQVGRPGLIDALQWVAVGVLTLGFLWFRPRGILPERKRVWELPATTGAAARGRPSVSDVRESGQAERAAGPR